MHVLSPKETSALLSVLRPDTTFEGAAQHFSAAFASDKSFRVCCGAVLLLEVRASMLLSEQHSDCMHNHAASFSDVSGIRSNARSAWPVPVHGCGSAHDKHHA